MQIIVRSGQQGLNWGARGEERIAQNVQNLINTYRYEVPYNRLMGIDPSLIDRPTPYATEQLKMGVRELVRRFEPRAQVLDVVVTHDGGDIQWEVVIAT